MIPKIIHYCWFGRNPLSKNVQKYIQTWKDKCPDYEIKEWNEDNFDVEMFRFTSEAYSLKKYAFVADVARLYALSTMGGIYLDTDVEVLKSFDTYLNNNSFVSFESYNRIGTAVIGAELGSSFIKDCLSYYDKRHFIISDGNFDMTPNTNIFSNMLLEKGLMFNNEHQAIYDYIDVYPRAFFSAKIYETGELEVNDITVAIHHFDGSWLSWFIRMKLRVKHFISNCLCK